MTLLYYDPLFLEHRTGRHPESPERLQRVMEHLAHSGLEGRCTRPEWEPIDRKRLARTHDLDYAARLQAHAQAGGGQIEADTVMSPASYDVALKAAGAVCNAVERIVAGEARTALCLGRPPGHHALRAAPMGFCLFNHVALGAAVAVQELGLDRVLVVDWDVHHGNGTQDAFYDDPQVGFLSIHRWPFYPGTGAADERGTGTGLGTTVNLPIRFGTPREEYHARFRTALQEFADQHRPQLVLVSAGFDSHRLDPIGSLGLEVEDFETLSQVVNQVAAQHAGGRVVSVLEGGYNPGMLAASVAVHLGALLEHEAQADG